MNKDNSCFSDWFAEVRRLLKEMSDFDLADKDSVIDDYEAGRDATDVVVDIIVENGLV